MKTKIVLILAAICLSLNGVLSQNITLDVGQRAPIFGKLLETTDTTVTVLIYGETGSQSLVIPAFKIKSGKLPHNGKLLVQDGKIVILSGERISTANNQQVPGDPNYAIGRALKVTGATSMIIGIPCFVAGLATCIAGHTGKNESNLAGKAKCAEASYYLFGMGASLTVIGIPLYISGKKVMDLHVNYTGNGAGLALNF